MFGEAIFERLDHALSKYQWLQLYPIANVQTLPILGLHHAPILLDIG